MNGNTKSRNEQPPHLLKPEGPVSGVRPENYHAMARAFAVMSAKFETDVGLTINPIDNPQQWGAWLNYFKTKKINHVFMTTRGNQCAGLSRKEAREATGFQVPSSMPSDFDADWDFLSDSRAGDSFMAAQERARSRMNSIADTPEERAAVVRRALQRPSKTPPTDNSEAAT